jgi:hypothetical protein
MSARADTHVGIWRCWRANPTPHCSWELRITGSEDYVRGRTARRLAFLEVLDHDTRAHWPSRLLGEFIRGEQPRTELAASAVEELVPSPEAELVS